MKIRHFFFCSLLALDAGRLFVAPVYPHAENALSEGQPAETLERAVSLVEKRQLGGVLFKFYWEKEALKNAVAQLKDAADYPLVLCIDCETGLAQRLPSYDPLPKPTTHEEAFAMGQAIGRQLKEIGLNMALAPVLDVNTNPQNPVIGKRALGSDPDVVAELGAALIRGIQSEGVLACGKHYPGHGDTHVDSHYGLPVLDFDRKRLDAVELKPFRAAIDAGVAAIMTGHLVVTALDDQPASLSPKVTEELRKEFEGIIITDDLLMKAVQVPHVALRAYEAGADLILVPPDLEAGIEEVRRSSDPSHLEERVNRIAKKLRAP